VTFVGLVAAKEGKGRLLNRLNMIEMDRRRDRIVLAAKLISFIKASFDFYQQFFILSQTDL
jgi:hypothetical protein